MRVHKFLDQLRKYFLEFLPTYCEKWAMSREEDPDHLITLIISGETYHKTMIEFVIKKIKKKKNVQPSCIY